MKSAARCQRCGFYKESHYGNEKCPRCGAFLMLVPVMINGEYFS